MALLFFGGNGNANGIRRSGESMIGNIGAYGRGIGINRADIGGMSFFGGRGNANGIRRSGESMIGNIGACGSGIGVSRADIGGIPTVGGNGDANGGAVIGHGERCVLGERNIMCTKISVFLIWVTCSAGLPAIRQMDTELNSKSY